MNYKPRVITWRKSKEEKNRDLIWLLFALCAAVAFFVTLNTHAASLDPKFPWESLPVSLEGKQQVYGTYTNGCIIGGEEIPNSTPYWESVNTYRNRHYVHKDVLSFLERLAKFSLSRNWGKLILGDTSLPAGGTTIKDHNSHQLGLETDIRFQFFNGKMDQADRNGWPEIDIAKDVVIPIGRPSTIKKIKISEINRRTFRPEYLELVRFSAEETATDRIFISPPLKLKACEIYRNGHNYPAWLKKLRPWSGHTAHFHVRRKCPADSPQCKNQGGIPNDPSDPTGVGCGGRAFLAQLEGVEVLSAGDDHETPEVQALKPLACRNALKKARLVKISDDIRCLAKVTGTEGNFTTDLRCRDYSKDEVFPLTSKCTPDRVEANPGACVQL